MENKIKDLINSKQELFESIQKKEIIREEYLKRTGVKQIILNSLEAADKANLWTDEGRSTIHKEHVLLNRLIKMEEEIRSELNDLNKFEYIFHSKLENREIIVPKNHKDILMRIMLNHAEVDGVHDLENMGIFQLIAIFYNTHKDEINWDDELGKLLMENMIQELIFGKFIFIGKDWEELIRYNDYEKKLLLNLKNKLSLQISVLREAVNSSMQESPQSDGSAENRLLREVVQTGAALLHTALPSQYSQNNTSGYQDIISPKRIDYYRGLTAKVIAKFRFYNPMDTLKENGVNEAVYTEPLVEDVYEDVPIKVEGRFGIGTKTEIRKQKIGDKPVLLKQVINGGSDEEAHSLVYYASDCGQQLYPCYDGRFSNFIFLQIVLPKSIAEQVFSQVKTNLKFIRIVVEEMIINNLGIPSGAWSEGDEFTKYPLRPPYEKWSGKNGSKIYIQEQGTDYSFNVNFVKSIQ